MVITYFTVGIIVFHLVEWVGVITKSSEAVTDNKDMVAFSYLAISTRHEVSMVPAGRYGNVGKTLGIIGINLSAKMKRIIIRCSVGLCCGFLDH